MITQEEYDAFKEAMIEEFKEGEKVRGVKPRTNFTLSCDNCGARFSCEFAGDMYNLDGDCLAEK